MKNITVELNAHDAWEFGESVIDVKVDHVREIKTRLKSLGLSKEAIRRAKLSVWPIHDAESYSS